MSLVGERSLQATQIRENPNHEIDNGKRFCLCDCTALVPDVCTSQRPSRRKSATPESSYLETLARFLLKARGSTQDLSLIGYCVGTPLFYYLLFRSKLVPRFISVWGLVGVTLLFVEIASNIFGRSAGGMIIMLPLGLNEVFLGVWLMARGFNEP